MDYKEASRIFNIPVPAFNRMKKKGLIDGTIEQSDKPYLIFLCKIWGDNEFLRMQLSQKTKKVRLRLIEPKRLNRLERHILTRFENHYRKSDGEWLYAGIVEQEVRSLFKIPITQNQSLRKIVLRMRQKAKNKVRRSKASK